MDLFEAGAEPAPSSVAALNSWAERQGLQIRPVYITAPSTADLSLGYVAPLKELEQKLEAHVHNLGFQPTLPAKVLVDNTSSRKGRVECFLDFAEREGAEAIALTSHGRSGLDRFLMGSFAEALLQQSSWPVFFLTHAEGWSRARGEKPSVFFATDFSPSARAAFERFLTEYRLGDLRLVLFHSINFPVPYAPIGSEYVPENYFAEQEAWAKQMAAEWTQRARDAGVEIKAIVSYGGMSVLTGREVLDAAKAENSELIVLATASGPVERTLLGSVAFDIFRARKVPVLIYGPSAVAAASVKNDVSQPASSSGRVS